MEHRHRAPSPGRVKRWVVAGAGRDPLAEGDGVTLHVRMKVKGTAMRTGTAFAVCTRFFVAADILVCSCTPYGLVRLPKTRQVMSCMALNPRAQPFPLPCCDLISSSQAQHDQETARLARLAALEGRPTGGGGGESASPLLASSDHDVLTLQVR